MKKQLNGIYAKHCGKAIEIIGQYISGIWKHCSIERSQDNGLYGGPATDKQIDSIEYATVPLVNDDHWCCRSQYGARQIYDTTGGQGVWNYRSC